VVFNVICILSLLKLFNFLFAILGFVGVNSKGEEMDYLEEAGLAMVIFLAFSLLLSFFVGLMVCCLAISE
ncbi:MAG: hypothetical protein KAH22_11780, partial [Thiotrichaceae bacterium]|nr:hypothetical protein [Thiotrichaceae bacterium]